MTGLPPEADLGALFLYVRDVPILLQKSVAAVGEW
jgi:hypothetical protein